MRAATIAVIAMTLACDRSSRSADSPARDTGSSANEPASEAPPASAPTVPAERATAATPADLDAPRAAFSRAFTVGDTTAFDSLFVPEGPVIDMAGLDPEPLQGSAGVRVFARRIGSDQAAAGPRFAPDTVQLDNGTARESGHWSWSRGSQKNRGTYSIAWRRDAGGRWRVAEYRFVQR